MNEVIGMSFEELDDMEMINVNGGGPTTITTLTTWSSLPCVASATVSAVSVTIVTIIMG